MINKELFKEYVITPIIYVLIMLLSVALIAYIADKCISGIIKDVDEKIEQELAIDSLKYENEKLILEVEHLENIKDATIIEIKSLDNDSTLALFCKLTSEEF